MEIPYNQKSVGTILQIRENGFLQIYIFVVGMNGVAAPTSIQFWQIKSLLARDKSAKTTKIRSAEFSSYRVLQPALHPKTYIQELFLGPAMVRFRFRV